MKALWVIAVGMLAALPAFAGDEAATRPRLVTGNVAPGQAPLAAPNRTEVFSAGGFSIGTVTGTAATATEGPVLGGYAAYSFDALRLSSSLKGDAAGSAADVTASFAGGMMGVDGVTSLTLGYERARPLAFSPNPVQAGLIGAETGRPTEDLSLSLSFTHDLNPSMSLGGFAAATRSEEDETVHSGFRLGAGLGVRF